MYKEIRALYTNKSIRVYQAFTKEIANEAIESSKFGVHFKTDRMTWIKPSFLWMMYRCNWSEEKNQEHVLAIDLKRNAFDYIVQNAVLSTYSCECGIAFSEWKRLIKESDIRCQWDPERDIWGNALNYRTIQLGLRGQTLIHYVNDWIINITDITTFVKEINSKRKSGINIMYDLPKETVYKVSSKPIVL